MEVNVQRLIQEFANLVAIDSPSYGEKRKAEYIMDRLAELGFAFTRDKIGRRLKGDCGNIYGYMEGTISGPPLLFSAHMDTVEPSRGKEAILHEDGTITGNGRSVLGADDNAGIACILEAVRSLKENNMPVRSLEVLFTVAEETYCHGSELFDFSKIRAKEAYVMDLEGPAGSAAYKAPSILSFEATVLGRAAHAGFAPQNGVHAIAAAAKAINALPMGILEDGVSLNIGLIEGGTATNIVPEHCVLKGEIRSDSRAASYAQAAKAEETIREAALTMGASVEFEILRCCNAVNTPLDHTSVRRFEIACGKEGITASLVPTFGGSDLNYLAARGIQGIVVASAMYNCHTLEEFTTVEDLESCARITANLMTSLF